MAKPSNDRIVELAQQIIDSHVEPGPLDREDLREALCELLERRNGTTTTATVTAPRSDT